MNHAFKKGRRGATNGEDSGGAHRFVANDDARKQVSYRGNRENLKTAASQPMSLIGTKRR